MLYKIHKLGQHIGPPRHCGGCISILAEVLFEMQSVLLHLLGLYRKIQVREFSYSYQSSPMEGHI